MLQPVIALFIELRRRQAALGWPASRDFRQASKDLFKPLGLVVGSERKDVEGTGTSELRRGRSKASVPWHGSRDH